jgi:hypothetical protein
MVHRRINKRSALRRSLLGLLALAMLLMSLTISRQQVLGPLHTHAEAGLTSAIWDWAGLDRLSHWRAHALDIEAVNATQALAAWPSPEAFTKSAHGAAAQRSPHVAGKHADTKPQRHQHQAGDASVLVVALDGATEAAGIDGAASPSLLPVLGGPAFSASLAGPASRHSPWPAGSATAFASWSATPPLRPPAV